MCGYAPVHGAVLMPGASAVMSGCTCPVPCGRLVRGAHAGAIISVVNPSMRSWVHLFLWLIMHPSPQ